MLNPQTDHDKNSLNSIVNICSIVIGVEKKDLASFCDQQIVRKPSSILSILQHRLAGELILFSLRRCYAMLVCRSTL